MSIGAASGQLDEDGTFPVAEQTCSACEGLCAEPCPSGAIQANPDGSVSLISEFCGGCGGCIAVCGFGRISRAGGVARFADGPVAR